MEINYKRYIFYHYYFSKILFYNDFKLCKKNIGKYVNTFETTPYCSQINNRRSYIILKYLLSVI